MLVVPNSSNKKVLERKMKTNRKWHFTKCHKKITWNCNVTSAKLWPHNAKNHCTEGRSLRSLPVKDKKRNPSVKAFCRREMAGQIMRQNFNLRPKVAIFMTSKRKRSFSKARQKRLKLHSIKRPRISVWSIETEAVVDEFMI